MYSGNYGSSCNSCYPVAQMPSYGYGCCPPAPTCGNNGFVLIIVLFILLIIVGSCFC